MTKKKDETTVSINNGPEIPLTAVMQRLQEKAETSGDAAIQLKKAKILNGLFLEAAYTQQLPGHSKKKISLECTVPVHEDLLAAFAELHGHFAFLCSQEKIIPDQGMDEYDFSKYTVSSYTLGGKDEGAGITISGALDGEFGSVHMNTPFTKYSAEEYQFIGELAESAEKCTYEVMQYLFHGKRAPEKQLGLEFGDEGSEDPGTYAEEGL